MAKLIYAAIASLDGFIEDQDGNFDWAAPDKEVLAFVNDLERPIGTYLYRRRMYETMLGWETEEFLGDRGPLVLDFAAIWRKADKIVFSKTLEAASSTKTRIEPNFDPHVIRALKASESSDLTVGGPDLAAHAFRAGLVDNVHLFVNPIVVGGGKRALPSKVHTQLELLDKCRFDNGVVHLHYAIAT